MLLPMLLNWHTRSNMRTLQTRVVRIYPRNNTATTEYWDMEPEDETYIYQWLMRLMADMSEQATADPEFQREWFRRRPGLHPRGRSGPNSHASILGGICSAKIQNPRRNLSTPQLDTVEYMFNLIAQYYSDLPEPPTAVAFQRAIFEIS